MTETKISMAQVRAQKGRVNQEVLDRTSEADTRRHALEDGVSIDQLSGDWWPSPKRIRTRMGKTQEQVAQALGIPMGTWRNWEQGRAVPDPAGRALLRVAYFAPDVVLDALARMPEPILSLEPA